MIESAFPILTRDGAAIQMMHWSQSNEKPHLHWAHATGFNAKTYTPLLRELLPHFKVHTWDMRGHGESRSAGNPKTFRGWTTYYNDLIAVLDQASEPMWLAGHSIGATTSLAAAAQRPDKVKGLILVEPVLLDPKQGWALRLANWFGFADRIAMATAAARRRASFASHEEAFENYRSKKAFSTWSDEWLNAYVQHGFMTNSNNEVELACPPSWESLTFQHTEPDAARWIRDPGCPIHILAAGKGSTFPSTAHARIQKRLPKARIEVIADATHFLPMEHTGLVVQRIREVAGLGFK
ncbi:MAG: alpha/beta hydrolase [Limnobacter sp.]|uniref:alpha/beta fold hydrolase n=1 Tax=Limnobacter sp. TaxID=2003368 RepID=UPI002734D9D6|nr:alpha/beta hydrolase [Limnobacter sp.]MDP2379318.1 alpha/beta hydrolase [Pseudohongiella sp.]MDP3189663.1 alpha/beta hydrolase [Limnobacter sp.]